MCGDCVARQSLNDRLILNYEERIRILIDAFVKYHDRRRARRLLGDRAPQMRRMGIA